MSNFEMETVQISKAEMMKRVARRNELKASSTPFLDTVLPGHEREAFNVIGTGVTEDAELAPAIPADGGFNVTYIRNKPGARVALHAHPTVEVFIPLTGRWAVIWNDDSDFGKTENEVVLEPGDCISVPVGVMRAFKNVGDEEAWLLVIFEGADAGKVTWPKQVLADAEKHGLRRDARGNIVRTT